jgi:hypothetical protein
VVTVKNKNEGELKATHQLIQSGEKKFALDDNTASNPPYIQLFEDSLEERLLTFLNPHTNSILFYNYTKGTYIRNISYDREGANAIFRLSGYYIKSMDSIYVYTGPMPEVVLTNSSGQVKERIQLRGEYSNEIVLWSIYYPQYVPSTVIPFIKYQDNLILTGMAPSSVRDTIIDRFRFCAYIDLKTNQAKFYYTYPKELYGFNYNWNDMLFTQVYPELSPTGELIHSFPMSHNLYITKVGIEDYRTVYGGSNVAGTIRSIEWEGTGKRTPSEVILTHYLQEDTYASIRYDPWRKVYYRFLLQGVPNAVFSDPLGIKPVIVIMMDEQFNYLGETLIGKGEEWNWTNSFVTEEGLNIEYIDEDDSEETYLNFKIFKIQSL